MVARVDTEAPLDLEQVPIYALKAGMRHKGVV